MRFWGIGHYMLVEGISAPELKFFDRTRRHGKEVKEGDSQKE